MTLTFTFPFFIGPLFLKFDQVTEIKSKRRAHLNSSMDSQMLVYPLKMCEQMIKSNSLISVLKINMACYSVPKSLSRPGKYGL